MSTNSQGVGSMSDRARTMNTGSSMPFLENERQLASDIVGGLASVPRTAAEVGLTMVTGGVGEVLSGYGGLYDYFIGRGETDKAAELVEDIQRKITYMPAKGSRGEKTLQSIGKFLQPVEEYLLEKPSDFVADKFGAGAGAATKAGLTALFEVLPFTAGAKLLSPAAKYAHEAPDVPTDARSRELPMPKIPADMSPSQLLLGGSLLLDPTTNVMMAGPFDDTRQGKMDFEKDPDPAKEGVGSLPEKAKNINIPSGELDLTKKEGRFGGSISGSLDEIRNNLASGIRPMYAGEKEPIKEILVKSEKDVEGLQRSLPQSAYTFEERKTAQKVIDDLDFNAVEKTTDFFSGETYYRIPIKQKVDPDSLKQGLGSLPEKARDMNKSPERLKREKEEAEAVKRIKESNQALSDQGVFGGPLATRVGNDVTLYPTESKPGRTLLVVGCCKTKKEDSEFGGKYMPAEKRYIGESFKVLKNEGIPDNVDLAILSAKDGLIHPLTPIKNYDVKMDKGATKALLSDPNKVNRIKNTIAGYDNVFVAAGKDYRSIFDNITGPGSYQTYKDIDPKVEGIGDQNRILGNFLSEQDVAGFRRIDQSGSGDPPGSLARGIKIIRETNELPSHPKSPSFSERRIEELSTGRRTLKEEKLENELDKIYSKIDDEAVKEAVADKIDTILYLEKGTFKHRGTGKLFEPEVTPDNVSETVKFKGGTTFSNNLIGPKPTLHVKFKDMETGKSEFIDYDEMQPWGFKKRTTGDGPPFPDPVAEWRKGRDEKMENLKKKSKEPAPLHAQDPMELYTQELLFEDQIYRKNPEEAEQFENAINTIYENQGKGGSFTVKGSTKVLKLIRSPVSPPGIPFKLKKGKLMGAFETASEAGKKKLETSIAKSSIAKSSIAKRFKWIDLDDLEINPHTPVQNRAVGGEVKNFSKGTEVSSQDGRLYYDFMDRLRASAEGAKDILASEALKLTQPEESAKGVSKAQIFDRFGTVPDLGYLGYDVLSHLGGKKDAFSADPEKRPLSSDWMAKIAGMPYSEKELAGRILGGLASFNLVPAIRRSLGMVKKPPKPPKDEKIGNLLSDELPMDEASRMQRAREMGFGEELYHGTVADIDEFEVSDLGVHLGTQDAANVRLSDKEATRLGVSRYKTRNQNFGKNANVLPVRTSVQNPLRMDDAGEWRDPSSVITELRKSELMSKNPKLHEHFLDMQDEADKLHESYASGDLGSEGWYESPEASEMLNEIREMIEAEGYDSIKYTNFIESRGKNADSIIVFNPKNIRSRHAKFDPAKKDSAKILFSSGGGIHSLAEEARTMNIDEARDLGITGNFLRDPYTYVSKLRHPEIRKDKYNRFEKITPKERAGVVASDKVARTEFLMDLMPYLRKDTNPEDIPLGSMKVLDDRPGGVTSLSPEAIKYLSSMPFGLSGMVVTSLTGSKDVTGDGIIDFRDEPPTLDQPVQLHTEKAFGAPYLSREPQEVYEGVVNVLASRADPSTVGHEYRHLLDQDMPYINDGAYHVLTSEGRNRVVDLVTARTEPEFLRALSSTFDQVKRDIRYNSEYEAGGDWRKNPTYKKVDKLGDQAKLLLGASTKMAYEGGPHIIRKIKAPFLVDGKLERKERPEYVEELKQAKRDIFKEIPKIIYDVTTPQAYSKEYSENLRVRGKRAHRKVINDILENYHIGPYFKKWYEITKKVSHNIKYDSSFGRSPSNEEKVMEFVNELMEEDTFLPRIGSPGYGFNKLDPRRFMRRN